MPGPGLPDRRHHQRRARDLHGLHDRPRPHRRARARPRSRRSTKRGREAIIVTELPYQVNKARLLERIADLVREKKIEGISELRDESDKDGMRVVIELQARRDRRRRAQQPLQADADASRCSASTWSPCVDGQPQAAEPEGDARGLPPPPPRGGHAPHRVSTCARRASAATSSKAWPSRWPTSTRSSR